MTLTVSVELVPVGAAGLKTPVTPVGVLPRLKVTASVKLVRVMVTAVGALAPRAKKPSTRDWLIGQFEDAELWHDPERVAYATVPVDDPRPRLLMSPRGRRLDQRQVRDWVAGDGVVIVCGRFEGVDERVIEGRGLTEVSIGDYILSGGEMAAMVLLDACVRLIPGVMGKQASGQEESFENGLLEYPHYTRPRE